MKSSETGKIFHGRTSLTYSWGLNIKFKGTDISLDYYSLLNLFEFLKTNSPSIDFWSNLFRQPYLHEVTTDWKEKPFLAFFLGWTVAKAVSRLEYSKPRQKRNYTIDLYLRRPQIDRFGKSVIPVNIEQNNCNMCSRVVKSFLKNQKTFAANNLGDF